jgi:predicted nucleotidyltransferase
MDKEKVEKIKEEIKKFKKKIKADEVIIFGSFARGEFGEDSDIDLLLVSKKFRGKKFHERFKGLWLKWHLDLPVDFICYTPEEFNKLKKEVSIVSEALREGIRV